MKLTEALKVTLMDIVVLIAERDIPSNNTEARLIERSGCDEETVAWCISVLWNENEGWISYDDHPQTGERGYVLNSQFDDGGGLDKLYASFRQRPTSVQGAEGIIALDEDDEDPDDEWTDDIDDEDDSGW